MARNRKNQAAGLPLEPALKASLICACIVLCCVGYVWQKKQISELSRQIRDGEKKLESLRDRNDKMKKQLAGLLSPTSLDARAKELNLGLTLPDAARIWRLPEPAVQNTAPPRAQQYASGGPAEPDSP